MRNFFVFANDVKFGVGFADSLPTVSLAAKFDQLYTNTGVNQIELCPTKPIVAIRIAANPYLLLFNYQTLSYIDISAILPNAQTKSFCEFSPDGSLFAVATSYSTSYYFMLFETVNWTKVTGTPTDFGTSMSGLRFSPDGTQIAIGSTSLTPFRVYNISDWSLVSGTPTFSNTVAYFDWSPANDFFSVANFHVDDGSKYTLYYDPTTWLPLTTIPKETTSIIAIRFSPNGQYLAHIENGNILKWYNITTGTLVTRLSAVTIKSVSFSADSAYLITDLLFVYRTSDGALVYDGSALVSNSRWVEFSLSAHLAEISGVVSDIDENLIATTVRVHNRTTGLLEETLISSVSGEYSFLTFNQTERNLIALCPTADEASFNDLILRASPG